VLASVHGVCVGVSLSALTASQWVQLRERQREAGKADKREDRGKVSKERKGKEKEGRKAEEREGRIKNGV
jgi:hypothetical protein